MDVAEVLVSTEDGGETGAIVEDADGRLWLSDSTDRVRGTGLRDYEPHHQGLSDGRTLMGGRLPPGATTAEVVDDAGQRHQAAAAASIPPARRRCPATTSIRARSASPRWPTRSSSS